MDDEERVWIETGEHIDEYDDSNDEGVEKLSFDKDNAESARDEPVEMRDFMCRLRRDQGVFVSWRVREIVSTGDQALVLGQILYWFDSGRDGKPRARIWRDDRNWLYKTHEELGRETGMKPRQVRACLQVLEDKGFIVREYHRANGLRTTYISLNLDQVVNAMAEMHQNRRKNAGAT